MSIFSIPKNPLKNLFHRNSRDVTEHPPRQACRVDLILFSLMQITFTYFSSYSELGNATLPSQTLKTSITCNVKQETAFQKAINKVTGKKFSYATTSKNWPNFEGYEPIASDNPRFYSDNTIAYNKTDLLYLFKQSQDYYEEHKKFSTFLNQKHSHPKIQKRADTVKNVIELVSKIKNPVFKAEVISAFVNMAFPYDKGKEALSKKVIDDAKPKEIEFNSWTSAFDMIKNGKGVCIDQVALKAEMLISCAVNPENILILSLKSHVLLGIKTPKGIATFDNEQFDPKDAKTISLEKNFMAYLGGNENMDLFNGTYELLSVSNMNFQGIVYTKLFSKQAQDHYEPDSILTHSDPDDVNNMEILKKVSKITQDYYKARGGRYLGDKPYFRANQTVYLTKEQYRADQRQLSRANQARLTLTNNNG